MLRLFFTKINAEERMRYSNRIRTCITINTVKNVYRYRYRLEERRDGHVAWRNLKSICRENLKSEEMNVNKQNSACYAYESLGFQVLRSEKNSIGNGFFVDDYVYRLEL